MKQIFYFFIFYEAFTAQIEKSLNSLNSSLSLSPSLPLSLPPSLPPLPSLAPLPSLIATHLRPRRVSSPFPPSLFLPRCSGRASASLCSWIWGGLGQVSGVGCQVVGACRRRRRRVQRDVLCNKR